MLSTEIATELKGRGISVEVFPLSFREFLRFRGKEPSHLLLPMSQQQELASLFDEYLRIGGFPEVQRLNESTRIAIQQEQVEIVMARDICLRHDLSPVGVEAFVKMALRGSGREFSVNKTYHALESAHVPLARDTAYALPAHCEDAYLFFIVSQFSRSYKKQISGVRKLYAIDQGLQYAISSAATQDLGQRFEDTVFLQLRRGCAGTRDGAVSLYRTKDGREIDFVIGDAISGQVARLIQVSLEINSHQTAKREYAALTAALDETGLSEGEVIVLNKDSCIPPEDPRIRLSSAWQWFLT